MARIVTDSDSEDDASSNDAHSNDGCGDPDVDGDGSQGEQSSGGESDNGSREGGDEPPAQRQCVKLGERPTGLPKTVDRRTLDPCLSALYDPDTSFYGNELTFTRVYSGRCIEGTVYTVPEDGDGLYQFVSAEIQRLAFQSKDASVQRGC